MRIKSLLREFMTIVGILFTCRLLISYLFQDTNFDAGDVLISALGLTIALNIFPATFRNKDTARNKEVY